MNKILRLPDVIDITRLGKTTIYQLVKDGSFPKPIKITGARTSGWLLSEVEDFIQQRANAREANKHV